MKITLENINRDLENFAHILTCKIDSMEKRIENLEKAHQINVLDNLMNDEL